MKIVKPSWHMSAMTEGEPTKLMKHLEAMGRVCYQSADAVTEDSYKQFLRTIIEQGHEAVLEHATVTAIIVCDRGISHELVRHRIASYCQESTRYCNYNKGKFGSEITVVEPTFVNKADDVRRIWKHACEAAEVAYFDLIAEGTTPQQARDVLPTSLKTQIAVTMNIREWRHFFRLRCAPAAHPDMIALATGGLVEFHYRFPVLFEDVYQEVFCND